LTRQCTDVGHPDPAGSVGSHSEPLADAQHAASAGTRSNGDARVPLSGTNMAAIERVLAARPIEGTEPRTSLGLRLIMGVGDWVSRTLFPGLSSAPAESATEATDTAETFTALCPICNEDKQEFQIACGHGFCIAVPSSTCVMH